MLRSPSTRRAWIEIPPYIVLYHNPKVALHPEGVDRNWTTTSAGWVRTQVALHPEGVDRNKEGLKDGTRKLSRPPPGGRG